MPAPVLQLAFQADENYVDGLVATLCGVAGHLPRETRVDVFLIDCGIRPETRDRLAALIARRFSTFSLYFVSIDGAVLARLPFPEGLKHANRSVYGRLFLPELLPEVDRVLYLDCDLLIDADVSPLAAFPLKGAMVAAAVDEEMRAATAGKDTGPDFNSGVMVMDLKAMRAEGLTRRAVDIASAGNTRHGDQTLLNELLRDRWTPLDHRWNRQIFLLPTFSVFRTEPHTIWHIYMGRKPWHFHRAGARGLVAEYYAHLDRAGWTPTSAPQLHLNSAAGRDVLKNAAAALRRNWLKLR